MNNTTIRARGYTVTLPTSAVAGFLTLSHDDQVELAEQFNRWDARAAQPAFDDACDCDQCAVDEVTEQDTADIVELLIEEMAQELDAQDFAIDAFMDEREDNALTIRNQREEINALVDQANGLFNQARQFEIEIEDSAEIMLQTARYVGQVRELLGDIGIAIQTDSETGQPVLIIR